MERGVDQQIATKLINEISQMQTEPLTTNDYKTVIDKFENEIQNNCDCPKQRNSNGYLKICTCKQ